MKQLFGEDHVIKIENLLVLQKKNIGLLLHMRAADLPRIRYNCSTKKFLRDKSGQIDSYCCFVSGTLKLRETMKGLTKLPT